MNTDPHNGFPTFGAAVRAQRIRTGAILAEGSAVARRFRNANRQECAISAMLAERVARGEGTFTR